MKTFFTIFFLSFFSLSAFCQDTIYTRNGEMIPAKVYEITQNEVKYKKPSNPDGPMYVAEKNDIAVIEYQNGSKEIFSSKYDNPPTPYRYKYSSPRLNVIITPPIIIRRNWHPIRNHLRRHYGWFL